MPSAFGSVQKTRSTLRLKNGAGILSADFVGVSALPLVAPLWVSLGCICFSIIDHSALGARCRSLLGRVGSRQVKREFRGRAKRP